MSTSTRKTNPHRRGAQAAESSSMPMWMKLVAAVCAVAILVGAGAFALSQKGLLAQVNGQKVTQDDLTKLVNYYLVTSPDIINYFDENTLLNQSVYYLLLNVFRDQLAVQPEWNITVSEEDVEKKYQEDLPLIQVEHLRKEATAKEIEFEFSTLYADEGVSATEVAYLEELVGSTGDALYKKALSDANLTEAEYRQFIHDELVYQALEEAVRDTVEVSEEEISERYETDKANKYEKLDLSHILIKSTDEEAEADEETGKQPEFSAEVLAEKEAELNAVLQQIKDGADFAEMAQVYSQDTSAENGGQLGASTREQISTAYVAGFREAAAALTEVGEVSEVIKSEFGYHIIRLNSIETVPLADEEENIETTLINEKARTKRGELLNQAEILPDDMGSSIKQMGW